MRFSRRRFLAASVPAGLSVARNVGAVQLPTDSNSVSFRHGVASGDPLADRVILWTRAEPLDGFATVGGEWIVARDAGLEDAVLSGTFSTGPARDWTVKVDATGLEADRWYFYGFRSGDAASRVGRTRTLPAGSTNQIRMAIFSCSNYPFGYFNSYRSAAERDDLDLAVHLGDYIYEYGRVGYGGQTGVRLGREVDPPQEILSLDDYRGRYAQYHLDQDLQALHARLPMVAVWDDHEIANNTWHSGAQNHDDSTEGSFAERRAAAVRSFHEWLPTRPRSGSLDDRIYRSYEIGDLATLIMLDTRLVGRDQQLDYGDLEVRDAAAAEVFRRERIEAPDRSMLGAEQEAWLKLELSRSKKRGVPWQILGQQLLVGGLVTPDFTDLLEENPDSPRAQRLAFMGDHSLPLNLDAWDGYGPARERFAQDVLSFADNVVVLSGDTHNSWAFDLLDRSGRQFGVELGTTSVTSPGLENGFSMAPEELVRRLQTVNPHLRFANTKDRGYMVLTIGREEVLAEWLYVDTVESRDFVERLGATARVRPSDGPGSRPLEIG